MTNSVAANRVPLWLIMAVAIIFLGTGASGLIYQVAWQRFFLNVFGATLYSVTAVLTAFMGGLALGSWILGKKSDSIKKPLAVYGVIEIVVGITALAVPYLLKVLDPFFHYAYTAFGSQFALYTFVKFLVSFTILLIPTTLMGSTLPLLSKFVTGELKQKAGSRIGILYSINTLGAVLGAFLGGFYLIRTLGVSKTVFLAAAINIVAGLISIILSRGFENRNFTEAENTTLDVQSPEASGTYQSMRLAKYILLAYFISGFVALGLEIVWSRALVFRFEALKNTTYAFTSMLTTFLIGITLGSMVMTPFVDRIKQPIKAFSTLQIIIGLTSIFSFFSLYYLADGFGENWLKEFDSRPGQIRWNASVALVFMKTAIVLLLPTFCMGLAFPLAVKSYLMLKNGIGKSVGTLYSLNTVGAILGSAVTGYFLLPGLGIANTIFLLAILQIIAGLIVLFNDPDTDKSRKITWTGLVLAAIVITLVRAPKPAVFQSVAPFEAIVHYDEGPLATVSVVQNSLGYRTIYVDNVGVAGTDPMLLTDQKSLAHVPMLMLDNPKKALTVGFGSGGASFSYTLYPELEQVDCVEITRTVPNAAPYLTASNHGVIYSTDSKIVNAGLYGGPNPLPETLSNPDSNDKLWQDSNDWFKKDPRFNIVLDDARSYLRFTDVKYDIIATDCTDLRYKSNANLYDREYFQLCRDNITENGMVVVWMPLAGLSDEAMKVALRTFHVVFPEMEVLYPNNQPTHYVLLLGTKKPLTVDVDKMNARLANPLIKKDLHEIYLDSAEKILSCLVTGGTKMIPYLATTKPDLNTEDFPYLEFESPRFGYGDSPLLDNLDELFKYQDSPNRLVRNPEKHQDFIGSLDRYMKAVPYIISGHRAYRQLELSKACADYLEALKINPADESVKDLLNFEELQRKVRGQNDSVWSMYTLAEVMAQQGRSNEAATLYNRVIASPKTPGESETNKMIDQAAIKVDELYKKAGIERNR